MSKWTLEKIKNCEEIKFGTKAVFAARASLVMEKKDSCLAVVYPPCDLLHVTIFDHVQFYRPDGTQIMPPEDKPKEKRLYAYEFISTGKIDHFTREQDVHSFTRRPEWDIVREG